MLYAQAMAIAINFGRIWRYLSDHPTELPLCRQFLILYFGQWLGYVMPFLLLCGPILIVLHYPLIGAVFLGLGLFAMSIKVDLLLSRLQK